MKQFRPTILALIMVLSFMPCYAQYDKYYKEYNNKYITTTPNATLYELPNEYSLTNKREIVNVHNLKAKRVRKPQQLQVVRYTNTSKQMDFNAYIVEYKGKLWVLYSSEVQDSSLLKEKNDRMSQDNEYLVVKYLELKNKLDKDNHQFSNTLLFYKKECTDSLNYYKNLKSRLPAIRDSLVAVKKAQEQAKANKARQEWYNTLPASTKKAASIISISEASLGSPNSAGGCDYSLYYTNRSKKTIKYLYWSGCVYNAVNDLVSCEIRNRYYFSGKDTGPVAYGEKGGGCWDCIIYNYSADRLKLDDIHITYMDGTSASIASADIRRLLNEPSTDIYVNTYEIGSQLISDTKCQGKINIWKERLSNIDNHKFYKGWNEKYHNDDSYDKIWLLLASKKSEIANIQNETNKAQKELEQFSKFINFEIYSNSKSGSSYSNYGYNSTNKYSTKSKKSPFVTFGLEGSFEGLKSFSTGWGVSMRIGRFNSLFNATVGIKYQYTCCKEYVWYVYSDSNYNVYSGNANYKQRANQLVIPLIANCNLYRGDTFAYYIGVGYEHGILSVTTRKYENTSDGFSTEYLLRSGDCEDVVNISTPSRTVIFQTGVAGRHWDWKVYYKYYANKSKFINGDSGAIGTAFTYYF